MFNKIIKMKIRGFSLFVMVFLISMFFLKTTVHAAVPYTYTPNTTVTNSIATKTINITFDYAIDFKDEAKITVYQASGNTTIRDPEKLSSQIIGLQSNILQITIGDLDPDVVNYAIKIEKGALTYISDPYIQLTDYILPFSSSDLASGFGTLFMDNSQGAIDKLNNIFMYNSMRDLSIYVPKKYITSIETINKKDGLVTSATNGSPRLTNIDVKTDATVKRLKVSITKLGTTTAIMDEKELLPSTSLAGFTTGVAGIDIDTESDYTLNVSAFDANGKLLEYSHYNKKLADVKTDIISDYVAKISTSSNKTITLYDLMKTPATLASLLQSYELANLDSVKVIYLNTGDTRVVSNSQGQSNDAANVLAKALNDDGVKYIKFASPLTIDPTDDVILEKPLTGGKIVLDGNGSTINGNVTIGGGSSDTNIYDLRNITINGDLKIDVSGVGDCILSNVTVKGTKTVIKATACVVTGVVSMENIPLYKIGDVIKVGVKFSEPVFVIGSPILNLNVGQASYDDASTQAIKTNDVVVFDYKVGEGTSVQSLGTSKINAITYANSDIQARQGASNIGANISLVNDKSILASTSKKVIAVDGIRPTGTYEVKVPNVIVYTANEPLDRASTEIASNWIVRYAGTGILAGTFINSQPEKVILEGDNKTVMIIMPTRVPIDAKASIFMTTNVLDVAKNNADNLLVAASTTKLTGFTPHIGFIDGTTIDMEYSLDNGRSWIKCTDQTTTDSNMITGLSVKIRTSATESKLEGTGDNVTTVLLP